MRIILGSSSIWRQQLMRQTLLDFEVMEPNIDERSIISASPQVLTMKIAQAKSEALRPRIAGPAILITSDQVVLCDQYIRGKPRDADEARAFLRSYRTRPAECVTAVFVYNTANQRDIVAIDRARVHFKNLTEEAIAKIIEEGYVFACAGGFTVGHPNFKPYVDRIAGTIDSAMGLPLEITRLLIADIQGTLP